jgi:nucleoside-diphosphate-sugar epimerase
MKVLITGATGQLGREVVPRLLRRGDHLKLLVRDITKAKDSFPDCDLVQGDILRDDLGIAGPLNLDAVYHLAADINLGAKHDDRVWATNYGGTANVVRFCDRNSIPYLSYAGTAYTEKGRNVYEKSKKAAEQFVESGHIARKTIFKIGILVPSLKEPGKASTEPPYLLGRAICMLHDRADVVKKRLAGTPPSSIQQLRFRIKGMPDVRLNVVPIDVVADFIVNTAKPGKFWLTHPNPPKLTDLLKWAGEVLSMSIELVPEFDMTAIEAQFHEAAEPFLPYLLGDEFPSDLECCPDISPEFAKESLTYSIINLDGAVPSKWLK